MAYINRHKLWHFWKAAQYHNDPELAGGRFFVVFGRRGYVAAEALEWGKTKGKP